MSHASQPSVSISARDIGRNGAVPNRCAQCLRYENSGLAVSLGASLKVSAGVCIAETYDAGAGSQWVSGHLCRKLLLKPPPIFGVCRSAGAKLSPHVASILLD